MRFFKKSDESVNRICFTVCNICGGKKVEAINFYTIIPGILISIIMIIYMKKDAKGENVDGKYGQNYFKLSYKSRIKKSLIAYPVLILVLIVAFFFLEVGLSLKITSLLIVLIAFLVEFIYNYKMWKKHEK